jgi:hypothetical protein
MGGVRNYHCRTVLVAAVEDIDRTAPVANLA